MLPLQSLHICLLLCSTPDFAESAAETEARELAELVDQVVVAVAKER
jgi:hypothetical protein